MALNCGQGHVWLNGECAPCLPGSYSLLGDAKCIFVPEGYYNPNFGASSYIPCQASLFAGAATCSVMKTSEFSFHFDPRMLGGYYIPLDSPNSIRYLCPSGRYSPGHVTDAKSCQPCNDKTNPLTSVAELMLCQNMILSPPIVDKSSVFTPSVPHSITSSSSSSTPITLSLESQFDILSEFYAATLGNGWNNNENWLMNVSLTEWFGLQVDADGFVTAIDLSSNNMFGTIPSSLSLLTTLVELNLNDNNLLFGSLPSSLAQLSLLETIRLDECMFTGHLSIDFQSMHSLLTFSATFNLLSGPLPVFGGNIQMIELWHNLLTGTIPEPYSSLPVLTYLDLDENRLSGSMPSALPETMQYLYISENMITGTLPPSLLNLSGIVELTLRDNLLVGSMPEFLGCALLELFTVSNNDIEGSLPSSLGLLTSILILKVDNNALSGTLPSQVGLLTAMTQFDVNNNALTGDIPDEVRSLTNLRELSMYDNSLTGPLPTFLGTFLDLQRVYLNLNSLTGTLPSSWGQSTSLEFLWLWGNQLSGSIPSSFGSILYLGYLDVSRNKLHGSLPAELGELVYLYNLDVSYNLMDGSIPTSFGQLNQMDHFFLSFNSFTGDIPSSLGSMERMVRFALNNNRFTGSIPDTLRACTWTMYFTVSYNSFTGTIPSFLSNFTDLIVLDLGSNRLHGVVPVELSLLQGLQLLSLSDNYLEGIVPTAWASLHHLQILNVSGNMLGGSLPLEILNMSSLATLDLSDNRLTGSLPLNMIGKKLVNLMLSSNRFSGELFFDVNKSSSSVDLSLVELHIDSNRFVGVLSADICSSVPNLRTLFVANNSITCFPSCLKLDRGDVYTSLPHCIGAVDSALCQFASAFNMDKLVNTAPTTTRSLTVGSSHPVYTDSIDHIELPGLYSYTLTFNPQSSPDYQTVQLCRDKDCLDVIYLARFYFPGVNGEPVFRFTATDGLDLYVQQRVFGIIWGYEFTLSYEVKTDNGWRCVDFPLAQASSSSPSLSVLDTQASDLVMDSAVMTEQYAPNFCDWYGVSCEYMAVTSLHLPALKLSGTIPSYLSLLTDLTSLDLSFNYFSGTFPSASFSSLTAMKKLAVTSNQLHGPLPKTAIAAMSSLQYLDFAKNRFTGRLPSTLTSLKDINVCDFSFNSLDGSLSAWFCGYMLNSTDLSMNLAGNGFSCYDQCWSQQGVLSKVTMPGGVTECVAALSKDMLTPGGIGGIVVGILVLLLLIAAVRYASILYLFYTYRGLPLHLAVRRNKPIREEDLGEHIHTAALPDNTGKTVVDLILKRPSYVIDFNILYELVLHCVPIEGLAKRAEKNMETTDMSMREVDKIDVDVDVDVEVWSRLIQFNDERTLRVVSQLLMDYVDLVDILAESLDSTGRRCLDIASPACKNLINRSRYLHRRYELKSGPPEHKSSTSVVRLAMDFGEDFGEIGVCNVISKPYPVALKFMRNRDQFLKEILSRKASGFDSAFVMDLLTHYDGEDEENENNRLFRHSACLKGFTEYKYCIVMDVAEHNLKQIIDQQHIVEEDWDEIKLITKRVAMALDHMHSKGVMHGDIKPMNIVKVGRSYRIIDLDASASFTASVTQYAGSKFSTAYAPPELLHLQSDDTVVVRTFTIDEETNEIRLTQPVTPSKTSQYKILGLYPLTPAAAAIDMWSFGALLYLLCTGMTLFRANVEDNIVQADLRQLVEWSPQVQESKLNEVEDHLARHLLSMLLCKDPTRRLSANRVLEHPFLTGRVPKRLKGQEPAYDVFLSYRVDSEREHVELLYNELRSRELKVWWDKMCLEPGQPWEEGFCAGLVDSACFVCLLSQGAINHPTKPWQNFGQLTPESRCDNVFLEWRLALELKERGMIEGVFPVFIGNRQTTDSGDIQYGAYFAGGCHPVPADCVVHSVENKLREHLDKMALGLPFHTSRTVRDVVGDVTANQGAFIVDDPAKSWTAAVDSIAKMRKICRMRSHVSMASIDDADFELVAEDVVLSLPGSHSPTGGGGGGGGGGGSGGGSGSTPSSPIDEEVVHLQSELDATRVKVMELEAALKRRLRTPIVQRSPSFQ